jgi:transcriptional regulator with XRE-family HTH domain
MMPRYRFDYSELARRRVALGLRREHLALQAGLSTEAVTNWEIGRAVPSSPALAAVCALLHCQISDLVRPVELPEERVG